MKKLTKVLTAILLIAILSLMGVTAFAEESVSPRLSHMSHGSFSFAAVDNIGYVDVGYVGYESFVRADLTVLIEKRNLLVFWNDVAKWTTWNTDREGDFYYEFPLNGTGMYRATFTLIITGNDGTTDTITDVIDSRY